MSTKTRVLLVDADSADGFPNLALMKISAWYKETMGTNVEVDLIKGVPLSPPIIDYDYVYISCIFFQNAEVVKEYASMVGGEVSVGGSGVDLKTTLSDEMEHIMPDYSLYNTDVSMGFTSRGCIRKCPWCLSPDTLILLADFTVKRIDQIREGDKVVGTTRERMKKNRLWKFAESIVLGASSRRDTAYRITLENGQEVVCSENHRWLTTRGWKYTTGSMSGKGQRPYLTENGMIRVVGTIKEYTETEDYMKGYVSGMWRGDGHIRVQKDRRPRFKDHPYIRLALTDTEALDRTKQYIERLGLINIHERVFREPSGMHKKRMFSIYSQRWDNYHKLKDIIKLKDNDEFRRGFVAGFFDAEGSHSGCIRMDNTDEQLLSFCSESLERFGFDGKIERYEGHCSRLRFIGNKIRFFNVFSPAISRKKVMHGITLVGSSRVKSIEKIGEMELYDIETTTGNFIANGLVSHNCIVPEKEGYIKDHALISEFLHPDHEKVIIHDNNFQASPRWRENLEFLISNDLKVNFGQGMDIRLVDSEFAEMMADVKYYDWKFKSRRLYFAFDTMGIEKAVLRGINILNDAGIPSPHLMFYVLVGHSTTLKEDLHRVDVLHKLGARPYIMRFNKDSKLLHLFKWVNLRFYEFIPFDKFEVDYESDSE